MARFCPGCRSFCSCTPCVPHSLFSPSEEAGLSCAQLCSTPLWSSWVRWCCFRGCMEGESQGLHVRCWQHVGTWGRGVKHGQQPGLTRQRKGEVSFVDLSASPGYSSYLVVPFLQREDCHRVATGMGTEGEEPVSPQRVWRGGKRSKLPVALFSEEVFSVNRACGRVCPGQR